MPLKRYLKSTRLKIALVDYIKNTFKVLVLFDTFPDTLDKGFLPNFVSFVKRVETN